MVPQIYKMRLEILLHSTPPPKKKTLVAHKRQNFRDDFRLHNLIANIVITQKDVEQKTALQTAVTHTHTHLIG